MNALKLANVTKSYKDFKLDDVSFELPKGYIMGFVGENGAGKSTTIKLILDLIKRDSGEIEILGEDPKKLSVNTKEKIGVVFDEPCFYKSFKSEEFDKVFKNLYSTWDSEKFNMYLKKFNLITDKNFGDYSKGMKMKFSVAVALSHNAEILILDEPTGGLDPVIREEILDIFYDFIQNPNHSILISSHITSDLEKICDYITFIHKGKVVFSESKEKIAEKYGVLQCSEETLNTIDKSAIIGKTTNKFNTEILVNKNKLPSTITADTASIEQIMLFYSRRDK